MSGTGSGYDLSVTTFSPDGRVFQVEYAQKAVENSGTALAICCKDGVIFATEKFKTSKMLVNGTSRRIFAVNKHMGIAIAGLLPDARQIVTRAQEETRSFKSTYAETIPPPILAERLGLFMHAYTLYWSIRPFGCAVLLGCVDPDTKEPSLFCVDPSGIAHKYRGQAIGKGRMAAKTEIEKLLGKAEGVTCEKALVDVARILHKVHDEKDRDFELEVSWICPATNYQHSVVNPEVLKVAEDEAKRILEAEDDA
jgi:20S proteasome subunit alpha 7